MQLFHEIHSNRGTPLPHSPLRWYLWQQRHTPYLIPPEVVSVVLQQLRDLLDIHGIVKGCGIANFPFVSGHLEMRGGVRKRGGEEGELCGKTHHHTLHTGYCIQHSATTFINLPPSQEVPLPLPTPQEPYVPCPADIQSGDRLSSVMEWRVD